MKFLFVLLSVVFGFFAGATIGSLTLPDDAGLTAGAIVIFDGGVGALLALLLSLVLMNRLKPKVLRNANLVLLGINLVPIIFFVIRIANREPNASPQIEPRRTTAPVDNAMALANIPPLQPTPVEMGLGMVKPDFYSKKVLYFYSPNLDKSLIDHLPVDSVVFKEEDGHRFSISYAPPWFAPAHLKMDYELLYLRLVAYNREWAQVVVNEFDGQKAWLSTRDVEILLWPEFLLLVNSVEIIDENENPLRVKALDHAGLFQGIPDGDYFLQPFLVKDDWLQVKVLDKDLKEKGKAWLRWRRDGKLLVRYSLLS